MEKSSSVLALSASALVVLDVARSMLGAVLEEMLEGMRKL